jgi:glycosyltransferase involved in cell wall biosynthesis
MKIALVIPRFKPSIGGGEEHVYHLASRLIKDNYEVVVYTSNLLRVFPSYQFLKKREVNLDGIPVKRYQTIGIIKQYPIHPQLPIDLIKEKPDVIHAHGFGWFTSDCSALVAYCKRIPLVLTTHGFFPVAVQVNPLLSSLYVSFSKIFMLRMAKRVVCVSQADASIYSKLTSPDKIRVIPNGIDVERWCESPRPGGFRNKYGIEGPIIACVGRIVWGKGFQYLIQALPKIFKKISDVTLVVAGEDSGYLASLRNMAYKLGVHEQVIFTGRLSNKELKELYVDTDVIAIPSVYEPFGIVALEAMICHKPVVAFKVGGLSEVIDNGVNGILIPKDDITQLAEALILILTDRQLAQSLAEKGASKARQYSWNNIVNKIESLYIEMAS